MKFIQSILKENNFHPKKMITAIEELGDYLNVMTTDFGRLIISKELFMSKISPGKIFSSISKSGNFINVYKKSIFKMESIKFDEIYEKLQKILQIKQKQFSVEYMYDHYGLYYFHGDIVFGRRISMKQLKKKYGIQNPFYLDGNFVGIDKKVSVQTIIDDKLTVDRYICKIGKICVRAMFDGILVDGKFKSYESIWKDNIPREFPKLDSLVKIIDRKLIIGDEKINLETILLQMGIPIEESPSVEDNKQIIACKNFDERNYFVISADGFSSITPQKYSVEEMEKHRSCRTCIVQSIFDKSCIVEKNRDRFELKFSRIQDYIICTDNDACVSGIAILIYDTAYYLVASTKDKLNNLIERIVTAIQ